MLFEQIPAYLEFFGFGTPTPDELRAVSQVGTEPVPLTVRTPDVHARSPPGVHRHGAAAGDPRRARR